MNLGWVSGAPRDLLIAIHSEHVPMFPWQKTHSAHTVSGKALLTGWAACLRSRRINFATPQGANSNVAVMMKDSFAE
jgi:hypothetical protein